MNFIEQLESDFNAYHSKKYRLRIRSLGERGENYSLEEIAGELTLKVGGLVGAVSGLSLLHNAVLSGHVADYLGNHHPKFPFRAIWIKDFEDDVYLLQAGDGAFFAEHILSLGFNTLLFEVSSVRLPILESFMKELKESGVKIGLKIRSENIYECHPFDLNYEEHLRKIVDPVLKLQPLIQYLFWETAQDEIVSDDLRQSRDYLFRDMVKKEVLTLEKIVKGKCQLIYFLTANGEKSAEKQSDWMLFLSHDLSKDTFFAFSSKAGSPFADYLPSHPIWKVLRQKRELAKANFLPVLNLGLLGQGEGLWPILTFDLINNYVARSDPMLISGAIAVIRRLPKKEALLSSNLWIAGYSLWGEKTPLLLAETWFGASGFPFLADAELEIVFREIREIALGIRRLSSLSKEEGRLLSESLLLRLKVLKGRIEREKRSKKERFSFEDCFSFFLRDSRRLIFRFLQQHQFSLASDLNEEDFLESFWTATSGNNGSSSSMKILLREEPLKGNDGSKMEKIYSLNRLK